MLPPNRILHSMCMCVHEEWTATYLFIVVHIIQNSNEPDCSAILLLGLHRTPMFNLALCKYCKTYVLIVFALKNVKV